MHKKKKMHEASDYSCKPRILKDRYIMREEEVLCGLSLYKRIGERDEFSCQTLNVFIFMVALNVEMGKDGEGRPFAVEQVNN